MFSIDASMLPLRVRDEVMSIRFAMSRTRLTKAEWDGYLKKLASIAIVFPECVVNH